MAKTQLSTFNNSWYNPGAGAIKRLLWYFFNAIFLNSAFPVSGIKIFFLRFFGAQIGKGVVIKPYVNVKYPWKLVIGNDVWIGEQVWIDNLAEVIIQDNVCVSQGALLLCGNHDFTKSSFDLMVGVITIEEGAWVGAKAVVCPGVKVGSHAVLAVGSVASKNLDPWKIYRGNPAIAVKNREIQG